MSVMWYYKCDNGSLGAAETESLDVTPSLPDNCHWINKDEYDVLYAQWLADKEAYEAELLRKDAERQLFNFTSLVNVGVPVQVARDLTGYQGPWPLPTP